MFRGIEPFGESGDAAPKDAAIVYAR